MKNMTAKRIICILLSVLIAAALPLSVTAAELDASPVIYIGEISENPLYYNPNKIDASVAFDINSSDFTGDMSTLLMGVALTEFAGTETAVSTISNGIKNLMEPLLCDENGNSVAENVGPWEYDGPISQYTEDQLYTGNIKAFAEASDSKISDDEIFFFSYDFRLNPLDSAEKLRSFIDHVEAVTGSRKVSLLTSGYGGIIANSYLYQNEAHAKNNVDSCVFYNTPLLGNAIISDFMRGKIARTAGDDDSLMGAINTITGAHRGDAFMTFINDDVTGIISGIFENLLGKGDVQQLFGKLFTMLLTTILSGQDGHKTLGKAYNSLVQDADDIIYDDFLRDYLRNIPGLWAMVSADSYEAAVEFLFEDEFINPELNKKITAYRAVLASTEKTLKTAQLNGINVCIVASYGYQILPVTACLDDMSDGIQSVKYASAGAVTVDSSSEGGKYIRCIGNHKHISPDQDIDAAYGYLPENTWFIKDLPHGDMTSPTVAEFVVWLVFGYSQRTVWDSAAYPQYLKFSMYANKLTANMSVENTNSSAKYGDADGNGTITAADARLVLRYSVDLETPDKAQILICDVDGDGKVSAADARLVLRYSVGLIFTFPAQG